MAIDTAKMLAAVAQDVFVGDRMQSCNRLVAKKAKLDSTSLSRQVPAPRLSRCMSLFPAGALMRLSNHRHTSHKLRSRRCSAKVENRGQEQSKIDRAFLPSGLTSPSQPPFHVCTCPPDMRPQIQ